MEDTRRPVRAPKWPCLLVLALLAVACGCHPPPREVSDPGKNRPSPPSAGIEEPYPLATRVLAIRPPHPARIASIASTPATGYIGDQPFLVGCALFWHDPLASYISLVPDVPTTHKRFDPRARRHTEPAFLVWLDFSKVRTGQWETSSDDTSRPADCPITRASVQVPYGSSARPGGLARRAAVVETGWTMALRIDSVVTRKSVTQDMVGTSIAGSLALRFAAGPAWVNGRFVAHDTLREDEVAPGQPTVPTPMLPRPVIPSPGAAGLPSTASPLPAVPRAPR